MKWPFYYTSFKATFKNVVKIIFFHWYTMVDDTEEVIYFGQNLQDVSAEISSF
jgi:hypothetical protein